MSILELENIRQESTVGIILGCLYVAAGITGLCMLWISRSDARAESRELWAWRAYGRYLKRR
jgi:hypothetical protein